MLGNKGCAVYRPLGKQIMTQRAEQTLRLPQSQLMIFCFLIYSFFVKLYKMLLHPLATIGRLIFFWITVHVTGIVILCHFSQKMSSTVRCILLRKLWKDVLAPTVRILWCFQAVIKNLCFYWANTFQYYAAKWTLGLLFVLLKQRMLPGASTTERQLYHSVPNCPKENSEFYQIMLRPVMKQIVTSLFLGFLDGVQEAACLSIGTLKYALTQLFIYIKPIQHSAHNEDILGDITCVLPRIQVPLCARFKGPATSILKDIPQHFYVLKFVVATEHIVSGPGKYGLDTTNIPLHERFQNNRMKNGFSSVQKTGTTVRRMKVACMVFIALYLSMFSSVIKIIR